jgi:hypothetical protein
MPWGRLAGMLAMIVAGGILLRFGPRALIWSVSPLRGCFGRHYRRDRAARGNHQPRYCDPAADHGVLGANPVRNATSADDRCHADVVYRSAAARTQAAAACLDQAARLASASIIARCGWDCP